MRGIVAERGESTGGRGLTGGKKKQQQKNLHSHLTSLLYPSLRPHMSKVMKSKLQHKIAKNKPLLFGLGAH